VEGGDLTTSPGPRRASSRLAAAPISWGICEIPGWGLQLPAERVLREMHELGFSATELGPDGFLPQDSAELRRMLDRHCLELVGSFLPLVLHEERSWDSAVAQATTVGARLAACGARHLLVAPVMDADWSRPQPLSAGEWYTLVRSLDVLAQLLADDGVVVALHPHLGTLVETADDVRRVLDGTDVSWCVDTGHMTIGGVDVPAFIAEAGERVSHVHLKDVRLDVARTELSHDMDLAAGVRAGMFSVLGVGDVPIPECLSALEHAGYDGWYVLEHDVALTDGPPADGQGPILDVRASVEYLRSLELSTTDDPPGTGVDVGGQGSGSTSRQLMEGK
jgi:inosose dehydratase